MDVLSIISLVLKYGPMVKDAIDLATSNGDLTSRIKQLSQPLAALLEGVGSALFPKAAPALHTVGGVIAAFDPNVTKWLQGALNMLLDPSPGLVVDGLYGPKTRDAVERLQAKLGLVVDGLAGSITRAAIDAALQQLAGAKA